jgi:hypothetical protein
VREHTETDAAEPAAEPNAALSFVRVMAEAHVATLPRVDGMTFLQRCANIFLERAEAAKVVPLRGSERVKKQEIADRQAAAEFQRMLESCIARMTAPPEEDEDDDI